MNPIERMTLFNGCRHQCPVTAIVGSAILGAGATIYASNQAADATKSAANAATSVQEQALNQQATLAAPYTGLGQSAIPTYQALLGINQPSAPGRPGQPASGGPSSSQIQTTLANLPGYQFTKSQGTDATKALYDSMGLGRSGAALEGIDTFTTGLADTNYQSYLSDLLQPIQIGQAAAAGQAANIGTAAGNISNIDLSKGSALAGIDANTIAGITRAVGGGVDNYLLYNTLSNLKGSDTGYTPPGGTGGGGVGMSGLYTDPGSGYTYNVPPGP